MKIIKKSKQLKQIVIHHCVNIKTKDLKSGLKSGEINLIIDNEELIKKEFILSPKAYSKSENPK